MFADSFGKAMGWTRPVEIDENLSPEYPVCLYHFVQGGQKITICREMEEKLPRIPPSATLMETLEILLGKTHAPIKTERVLGFYAEQMEEAEPLKPIRSERSLRHLFASLTPAEKAMGEVSAQDDLTRCISDWLGRCVAAAGAIREEELMDISVCVHPKYRRRGLGARCTAALVREILNQGLLPLYRVEENNVPSVRLAQRLGFTLGFTLEGALLAPTEREK